MPTFDQERTRDVAVSSLGTNMAVVAGADRRPESINIRTAVAGAVMNCSERAPSFPELAEIMGRDHHSAVLEMYQRYLKWPNIIRRMWEECVHVRKEAHREDPHHQAGHRR